MQCKQLFLVKIAKVCSTTFLNANHRVILHYIISLGIASSPNRKKIIETMVAYLLVQLSGSRQKNEYPTIMSKLVHKNIYH